jgi:uncharacterized membrane protein
MKQGILIFVRWISMLALGLWLGSLLFLGPIGAPGIFKFLRAQNQEALAPQLVGVLVERFAPVSLVLGALALLSWLIEGLMKQEKRQPRWKRLWMGQGACVMGMLALALYLNLMALPQMLRDQKAVIEESRATGTELSARGMQGKSEARRRFDTLHENYRRLTTIIFCLGAASLAAFAGRVSLNEKRQDSSES